MLTIRNVLGGGAKERLVAVASTSYDQNDNVLVGIGGTDGPVTFDDGMAYVMNDNGKTVAIYNLRAGKKAGANK